MSDDYRVQGGRRRLLVKIFGGIIWHSMYGSMAVWHSMIHVLYIYKKYDRSVRERPRRPKALSTYN